MFHSSASFHRCIYAVSNHDFVEAYKCQTVVVQYPFSKVENGICILWGFWLSVLNSVCENGFLYKILFNISRHFWRLSKPTKKKTGKTIWTIFLLLLEYCVLLQLFVVHILGVSYDETCFEVVSQSKSQNSLCSLQSPNIRFNSNIIGRRT